MKLILAILFLFCLKPGYNQNTDWTLTGILDIVLCVSGTGDMIWAATQNDGVKSLNKLTGEITTYNVESGDFITNDFRAIKCFDNKIYAGSYYSGLYIFENDTWTAFDTLNSPLPGNMVNDIEYDDSTENIYIATDKGLAILNNESWTLYDSLNSPLPGNRVTSLFFDKANRLWIGTRYAGLAKYIDDTWEIYNYDNAGINDNYIRTIYGDSSGILYVADYLGVDKYDPYTDDWLFVYNMFTSSISSNQVNRISFDHTGNLWFVTHNGVTKVDAYNYWTKYFTDNSNLPHNTSDGLFIDDDNNVWVGTFGGLAVINHHTLDIPELVPELMVLPNPVQSELIIQVNFPPSEITDIIIFNALGEKLFSFETTSPFFGEVRFSRNIASLNKGVYFVKVEFEHTTLTQPFVKY
ncbi:MAG: two-component regulator propeller domain-containing protein [Chitinophagales bacterium]